MITHGHPLTDVSAPSGRGAALAHDSQRNTGKIIKAALGTERPDRTLARSPSRMDRVLGAPHELTARIIAELKLARLKLECGDPFGSVFSPTIRAFQRTERRLNRPPRLAIMGEFNSGKSSLANLLASVECLPTAVVSNTRVATLLYYAPEPELWVIHESGKREQLRAEQQAPSQSVFRLEIGVPSQRLRAMQLLDLPGLADPRSRVPVVDLSLHSVDAILWCTVSTQAWKESERIAWGRLSARLRSRSVLVSTHGDLVHQASDAEKVLARFRDMAGPLFRDVVMLSIVDAHAVLRGEDAASAEVRWQATGADALEAAVCSLLRDVQDGRAAAAITMSSRLVGRARSRLGKEG